jgi:hypothetical protein
MKNLFNKIFVILIILLSGNLLLGQNITVDVPKVVEINENFRLVFSITGDLTSFEGPEINDFDILAGPSPATISHTEIINGRRTDYKTTTYTYILQPKREGQFVIPSAAATINGQTFTSSIVTIEVVKAVPKTDAAATGANPDAAAAQSRDSRGISNDDLFLRMTVNKTQVVKGESLILTIKLYTKVPIERFEDVRFPSFNGFWSQEIETPQNISFERENVNGTIYSSGLIRRYMLIPQQNGTINIEPSEMMCIVQIRPTAGGARSIFDSFFDSYQTERKRINSGPVKISVNPLPGGAPPSFSGGVGEFRMDARLSKDSLNANEAFSMIVEISGSGNVNLLEAPKISFPVDFETYDMKTTDNSRGASGSKRFEYPLIPRSSGNFKIPAVEFSYYDISKKQYVTLKSKDFEVKVGLDGTGGTSMQGTLPIGVNRQAVRSISDDVRYIDVKQTGLKRGSQFFFASFVYFISLALIVVLFFVFERLLSKRIERNRDIAGVKNRRANKVARAKLKSAEALLIQGLYTGFYEELYRALLGYVSDKLNLSIADLSKDNIRDELIRKSVKEDHIGELLLLLDQCEYARYAPDPGGGEMDKNYARAITLISEMEL